MREISLTAIFGGITTFLFGGWSVLLNVLLVLIVFDYITGMTASFFDGTLKSRVGFMGIARKVFIFAMVSVSHLVDILLRESGYEVGFMISGTMIIFYSVNEILSIIENAGRMGVKVPDFMQDAIDILRKNKDKKKGDDK